MATVVAFIDARIGDLAAIVDRLPPDADWYVLAADDDGIGQMRRIVAGYSDLAAIHVVSHGGEGVLYLGSTTLDFGGLTAHAAALADVGAALSEDGDLLLYGCDVGSGAAGTAFIDALAGLTGADVAASSDATGSSALGGNWALEVATGPIEAATLSGGDFGALLAASVSIAPQQAIRPEGSTGSTFFTFVLIRAGDVGAQQTVNWSVGGAGAHPADAPDFGGTLPSGTTTFAIGEINKIVAVSVSGDTAVEFDEGFTVSLSSASGGLVILNGSANGAIQNDDSSVVSVDALSATKAEGDGVTTSFTFTVSLDRPGVVDQTVDWSVAGDGAHPADAADFGGSLPSGTASFAAGVTSQVVTVLVSGDTAIEFDEGFAVKLSTPSAGLTLGSASAVGTVQNDDKSVVSIGPAEVAQPEGDTGTTPFTFTVSLDRAGVATQTVDWSVAGSGVHPADGVDFGGALPAGTVTFAAGETVKPLTVLTLRDMSTEFEEKFLVTLSNASAGLALGTASATGTIQNDDFPTVSIAALSADKVEGDVGTTSFTFTVSLDQPGIADQTVDWSVAGSGLHPADGVDFGGVLPGGTVTFVAGETVKVLSVQVTGDIWTETDEKFSVTLSNVSAGLVLGVKSATGTIQDDDPVPRLSIAALSAVQTEGDVGTTSFTFTVSLDQLGVADQTVDWSVAGSGVHPADGADFGGALPAGTVTFAAGETAKLVTVLVSGDIWNEPDEEFFVTLSNPSTGLVLGTVSATGTIVTDDFPPRFSIAALSAVGAEGNAGTTPFTFTVSLDQPSATDQTVDWSVAGSSLQPADGLDFGGALPAGTLTFVAGETSRTVTVLVSGDMAVEHDEAFVVVLTNPSSGLTIDIASATATVRNDDMSVVSIGPVAVVTIRATSQADNTKFGQATISLDQAPVEEQSVQWTMAGSGANPASADDFVAGQFPAGLVTFAPAETSKTISFEISDDSTVEPDETFTVKLADPSSGLKIGTATAQGTIVNDDVSVVSLVGGDRVVIEGSSWQTDNTPRLVWDVVLDQPPVAGQSVQWGVTGSGTNPASAADFVGGELPAGILTFAPGEISKTISFAVLPDSTVEPDETFTIELSNPSSGLAVGVGSAIVVVNGDDANVGMTVFSVAHAEGQDGATAFDFGLTRTALSLRDDIKDQGIPSIFTVAWSVEGKGGNPATASDFVGGVLPSGIVTMTADETTATITVLVAGDTSNEADESFVVVLSNPSPGLTIDVGTAIGTIVDDDRPGPPILQIAASGLGIVDGAGAVNAGKTVSLTMTMGEPVVVTGSPVLKLGNGALAHYDDTDPGFQYPVGWTYTVLPGQDTADLTVSSVDLAGGTIRNAAGVDADLSGAVGYNPHGTLVVDTTAPTIVSITTSGKGIADGTGVVGVGDTVLFTVTTSEPVTLTGAPVLELGNGAVATLNGQKDQQIFETYYTYVVLPGQDTSDLTVSAVSLASLGASVRDAAGNDASLSGAVAYDPHGTLAVVTTAQASLSGSMVERLEGDGGTTSFEFEVSLSGDLSIARSVSWSVTGAGGSPAAASDFASGSLPSGTLTFAIGEASKTIAVKVVGDTAVEPDQGFTVTLSNPSPGLALGIASAGGTIRNDDWKVMSSWAEDVGDSVILARAVDPDNLPGDWSTIGQFTISAGNDGGLFEIDATGGISLVAGKAFDYETTQRHVLTAGLIDHDGNSVFGPVQVTINIIDAIDVDEPFLALAPAAIEDLARAEGNAGTTAFHYVVTLSGDVDFFPPLVWSVTGSGVHAATASDFAGGVLPGGTVTFAPGETSKTITVEVMGDSLVELDESFKVTLSSPSPGLALGTASAEGTILDDDATMSIAVTDATESEGNSGTTSFTFTVTVTTDLGDTSTHEVGYWMTGIGPHPADASDFASGVLPSGTLAFAAGETSKTITVQVAGDTLVEANETFAVMINHDYSGDLQIGGYAAATGTILNDDATVSIAAVGATGAEGSSGATAFVFKVRMEEEEASHDVVMGSVHWSVAGVGANPAAAMDFLGGVLPSGTVTFAPGETSGTITVQAVGDSLVEADEGFTVTLSNPSPGLVLGTASAGGTILNDDVRAYDDAYIVLYEGEPLRLRTSDGLLANDLGATEATLLTNPSHGTVQLADDGSFTYTPAPGFFGIDGFSYEAGVLAVRREAGIHETEWNGSATIHIVPVSIGAATTLDLLALSAEQQIASTYAAFFGRAGDAAGFAFWVDQFVIGLPVQGAATLFANIASSFGISDEARALYPFLADPFGASDSQVSAFLESVYENLFDRSSDAGGLAYWTGQVQQTLAAGQFVGSVLINIMSGAQDTAAGKDITTLMGKVAVSLAYVHEQQDHHTVWAGASDIAAATTLLEDVTADPQTVLIGMRNVEALIAAHG